MFYELSCSPYIIFWCKISSMRGESSFHTIGSLDFIHKMTLTCALICNEKKESCQKSDVDLEGLQEHGSYIEGKSHWQKQLDKGLYG